MISGNQFVEVLKRLGITHVVWIPDSEIGTWDSALSSAGSPRLIRATREDETIAIAAGLLLGGAKPLLVMQCTGLFEAGDALRNFVHDLRLPLMFVIGVRSYGAHRAGKSRDTCPVYTEPILQAWQLPYTVLDHEFSLPQFEDALARLQATNAAGAVLLGE